MIELPVVDAQLTAAQQLFAAGDAAGARDALDRLLDAMSGGRDTARAHSDLDKRRARALSLRAYIAATNADLDQAIEDASDALAALPRDDDPEARMRILALLAVSATRLGLYEAAMNWAGDLQLLCEGRDDPVLRSGALLSLGLVAGHMGDALTAERLLLEALGLAINAGDETRVANCLLSMVFVISLAHDKLLERGLMDAARQALARGVRHVQKGERLITPSGRYEWALWRNNRAGWLMRRGELQIAEAEFTQIYPQAHEKGWFEVARFAAYGLGHIAHRQGDLTAAIGWYWRCLDESQHPDNYGVVDRARLQLAEALDSCGSTEAAKGLRAAVREADAHVARQRERALAMLERLEIRANVAEDSVPPS